MSKKIVRFAVVGPGRVGSSIAKALEATGYVCSLIVFENKGAKGYNELKKNFPQTRIVGSVSRLDPEFDLLFITVRDDQIAEVVAELSALRDLDWSGKVVFHVSGVVEVTQLSALSKRGASVAALHPISPFAARFAAERSVGIYYDFLGDSNALVAARKIVRRLHSRLLVLKSEKERILLHVASVIASNSTVIAARSARDIILKFVEEKYSNAILDSLLVSTVENLSKRENMDALTGPLVRGDAEVISRHIKALENKGSILQFYQSSSLLGIEALLKHERNKSRRAKLNEMKKLLEVG